MALARQRTAHVCHLAEQLDCLSSPALLVLVVDLLQGFRKRLHHLCSVRMRFFAVCLLIDAHRLPQKLHCQRGVLLLLNGRLSVENARDQRMPSAQCLHPLLQRKEHVLPRPTNVACLLQDPRSCQAKVHQLRGRVANVFTEGEGAVDDAHCRVCPLCCQEESCLRAEGLDHLVTLLSKVVASGCHSVRVALRCFVDASSRCIDHRQRLQHHGRILRLHNAWLHVVQYLESPVVLVELHQQTAVVCLRGNVHVAVLRKVFLCELVHSLQ
mmetsp:Transcript_743/g.2674  ORF Transcript_743/g.2674 Transcript_743/m.2674 type:complete len:269 (-) Transcript_743:869-1675(-)